jgi:hypothetical protein
VNENVDSIEGLNVERVKIHVERLEKDTPEEAKCFSTTLYNMLPRIKLTDLLLEVANWKGFDEWFIHASLNRSPKREERAVVMATLMAMGTNIGLTKMAEATPNISYHQMANTAQWRMYDDAMNRAQATLVNFQHRLDLSEYWGDGSSSSSDGMRVPIGVSSLHADANPHYGTGKGVTIYRFTSDQYSSFYTKVINTIRMLAMLSMSLMDYCIMNQISRLKNITRIRLDIPIKSLGLDICLGFDLHQDFEI